MSRYIDYDALDYKNWHMIGKSSDFIDGVVYMAERIEEAPSIDLADYVPKDFHDKTCEAMAKRHTEEIQKFMWIPCSERLPREYNDDERVLATTDVDGLGVILIPIYDVKSWYRKGYISAWMPLPEPYGEREGE